MAPVLYVPPPVLQAWAKASLVFSEDIAQEAIFRLLNRVAPPVNPVGWLWSTCKWLHVMGYTDGVDLSARRVNGRGGIRTPACQLLGSGAAVDDVTPEHTLLAKARARGVSPHVLQAMTGQYMPRVAVDTCRHGHRGAMYCVRRGDGRIGRVCRTCRNLRARDQRLALGRTRGRPRTARDGT